MSRFLLLPLWFLGFSSLACGEEPWVSVTIPLEDEPSLVAQLEARGVPVLAWSNAVVEVSAFEGLQTVPVARLTDQLSPDDPRWDPWLKEVPGWFHPRPGSSRVWVPSDQANLVADAMVPEGSPTDAPGVTGWAVVSLTLLFTLLKLASGVLFGWPSWRESRQWLWLPLVLLLLWGGIVLVGGSRGPLFDEKPVSDASWVQHRWFQETWPWGARWEDYVPGKVWTFAAYERQKGRLSEVPTPLNAGSPAWHQTLASSLDPRHAVKVFGSVLP